MLPFAWTRPQYALAALVYFVLISLLSAHVPDRLLGFLPDLEAVVFARSLITNLAHVPLFGGFAFFVLFAVGQAVGPFRSRPGPYVATVILTGAFGAVDEIHQAFVPGRFPSHLDLGLDVAGALLACSAVSAAASPGGLLAGRALARHGLFGALALVLGIMAVTSGHRSTLPWRLLAGAVRPVRENGLVEGFEREHAWRGAGPREARLVRDDFEIELVTGWRTQGETSLRVVLPVADWAGISTREVPVDLTGFRRIEVDVLWPEAAGIDHLGLRFIDYDGRDEELHRRVGPGVQTIGIDLHQLSRVDRSRIDVLTLMVRNHDEPLVLSFDRLRVLR